MDIVVPKQIEAMLIERSNVVSTSAKNLRNTLNAALVNLAEARAAADATRAVKPDSAYLEIQEQFDADARAVVAELAPLFVDATVPEGSDDVVEVESVVTHTIDGRVATAERLIDLAAQQIAQRFSHRPGSNSDEKLTAWLSLLATSIRDHYAELEKGL